MMNATGKWVLYGGYTLITTIFFLYLLFPEETIRQYARGKVTQMHPELSIEIDGIHPSFPPGLRFYGVSLNRAGNPLVTFDGIRISPEISTFFTQDASYGFLAEAYGGRIQGRFREYRDASMKRLSGHARIKDINLGKLAFFKTLPEFSVKGMLGGEILFNFDDKRDLDISAQLEIVNAAVELAVPMIALKTVSFKTVRTDMKLRSRTLILRYMEAKGPQMDGRISGSIFLRDDFKQSVLNLTGKMKPHHLLLAAIGKGIQSFLFSRNRQGPDGISFRINGTIEKPHFSFGSMKS